MTALADAPADVLPDPRSYAALTFATGLPPGWIEVAAHRTDADLRAFLERQMDADGDAFDAERRAQLVGACLRARELLAGQDWLHLGCVVTQVPSADVWTSTVWAVGVGLLRAPAADAVDPLEVARRGVAHLGDVDTVREFEVEDGRQGVLLGMTTRAGAALDEVPVEQRLPQLDPDRMGMYVVLLPVAGVPGLIGLTMGVAPNLDERGLMSVLAGQMAASLHVVGDPAALSPETVLVDTTGATDAARGQEQC